VVQHLDGEHDAAALAAIVAEWVTAKRAAQPPGADATLPPADAARAYVENLLPGLARGALLIA